MILIRVCILAGLDKALEERLYYPPASAAAAALAKC